MHTRLGSDNTQLPPVSAEEKENRGSNHSSQLNISLFYMHTTQSNIKSERKKIRSESKRLEDTYMILKKWGKKIQSQHCQCPSSCKAAHFFLGLTKCWVTSYLGQLELKIHCLLVFGLNFSSHMVSCCVVRTIHISKGKMQQNTPH